MILSLYVDDSFLFSTHSVLEISVTSQSSENWYNDVLGAKVRNITTGFLSSPVLQVPEDDNVPDTEMDPCVANVNFTPLYWEVIFVPSIFTWLIFQTPSVSLLFTFLGVVCLVHAQSVHNRMNMENLIPLPICNFICQNISFPVSYEEMAIVFHLKTIINACLVRSISLKTKKLPFPEAFTMLVWSEDQNSSVVSRADPGH